MSASLERQSSEEPVSPLNPFPEHIRPRGIVYTLPEDPPPINPYFPCPCCRKLLYDGGIARRTQCECGRGGLRDDTGNVVEVTEVKHTAFEDAFSIVGQIPEFTERLHELQSVTFGVFLDSLDRAYVTETDADFSKVVNDYLLPWLAKSQRSLGLSDMFACSTVQFKVLAAFPAYGLVSSATAIMLHESLHTVPLQRVAVRCIDPSSQALFDADQVSEFLHSSTRHFHNHEYLYICGVEMVVEDCDPADGVLDSNTITELNSTYLGAHFTVHFSPETELIPDDPGIDLLEDFLRPFFQGWRRVVKMGEEYDIAGVKFRAMQMDEDLGYVGPFTELICDDPVSFRVGPHRIQLSDLISPEGRRDILRGLQTGALDPGILGLAYPNYLGSDSPPLSLEDYLRRMALEQPSEQNGANLPVHQLTKLPGDPDLRQCTICIVDFEVGNTVKTLPCCTA